MNGAGKGVASANVTSEKRVAAAATSIEMTGPSALVKSKTVLVDADVDYYAYEDLPYGSSSTTKSGIEGFPLYIWRANTYATGGDRTDNEDIENSGLDIIPSPQASLNTESRLVLDPGGKSGRIIVDAVGTGGTAMMLRGYEWLEPGEPANLEDLKTRGKLKFQWLQQGPFNFSADTCEPIVIAFKIETDIDHFYFVSDGLAASSPNQPPVPSATTVPLASSVVATLAVTDDYTPVADVKIWIKDALTPSFVAGPFKHGDKIVLRKNPIQDPSSRLYPAGSPYKALVQTKGRALLVGEDHQLGITNPGVPVN